MMADVCLPVCRMPRPNSRTEMSRKPKTGRMEAYHTDNPREPILKVKRSKVKVTRTINAVTYNAPYAGRERYNFLKISL